MNATSALVLILVLSFAADRLAKAILFLLALLPMWSKRFPDPRLIREQERKVHVKNRLVLVYTVLVASIAGIAIWMFPELRIIQMLSGPRIPELIDIIVTVIVVMGGSDLVGRIVQISGIGEGTATSPTSSRNEPIEINGRLVLENPDHVDVQRRGEHSSGAKPDALA